ncbi:aspartate aminotransferase family protein [Aquibaculum arenosum]|uniref:Aspartate aminotransferase family protein n=1 Tax=Aquibaculum arenosum TaxID=3032591 RepID=A0ABT5YMH5_9PROT|nr:aspartate aminotransferase family protein [Fodinicurvata sp. CAU 1616]MDF2095965.1 aspartate aminotransferase family protein [Fodinicurvata sp. CAU 1616]
MQDSATVVSPQLPKIAWGRGLYLHDTDGKVYLDGSSGPAVYCIGHGNAEVNEAIKAQLDRVAHGYRYSFTSDPLEELTEIITRRCAEGGGEGLERMVFVSGGSEAVESCLKIALQYQSARGAHTRHKFIARQRSWHGNTLGALSCSGFAARREPFEGSLLDVPLLSPVNSYRPPKGVAAEDVAQWCADELEREILRQGPERIAAFIFEPVVGAAGGCVPAPPGYAAKVREICDRYEVVMIADEVMCGSGRCGTWRALQHDGVVPDVMSVAKGLAAGYMPLGAAVYHRRIGEVIEAAHGAVSTGHTFTGHTAACAAGVAVQRIVEREKLVEKVAAEGPLLHRLLGEALEGVEAVGDIRGRGFFQAVELVADRETKEPFPAELQVHLRVRQAALDRGLICYPVGGNVDGRRGDHVILAPPYNVTEAELAEITGRLGEAVRAVVAEVSGRA